MNLTDLIPVMGMLIGSFAVGFITGYGIYVIRRAVLLSTQ